MIGKVIMPRIKSTLYHCNVVENHGIFDKDTIFSLNLQGLFDIFPIMKPQFIPAEHEQLLYDFWEKKGYQQPKKGKPFTILMPPPNANASLHAGHGMYTIDDIMIRWKRLQGYASLWIPGTDHAGFETQYVYEKHLAKQGKSRLDFDRTTLYNNIYQFVKENSGLIFSQFKRLGFLADWSRSVFTLDDHVVKQTYKTFKKMHEEGIIYRDNYMVNYCTYCGTSLAELEVDHIERVDSLYYLKYGPFVLATVRPETKFGDTAVAVYQSDKRYKQWIGKEIEVEGLNGKFRLKVIADESVDPKFGTGVVKITPAHDHNDFETGKRHNLEVKSVIDWNGKLNDLAGPYAGLRVKAARKKIAEDLQRKGLMEKVDENYLHTVSVCYKCQHDLEPMILPNWFIKVENLKKGVIEVVNKDRIKFYPKKYKKQILEWLDIMHDWPISRQIVWGIRIPVWYEVDPSAANIHVWWLDKNNISQRGNVGQFLDKGVSLQEIEKGLQKIYALPGKSGPRYKISDQKPAENYLPETDTFDTWFSSAQWPLVTLKDSEYKERFPTDVMGTLSDILKFWISRMIMFSLYLKDTIPFKNIYLWSMVADTKGVKMSKSKGNVVNPIEMVDKYGADAFRASLLFGIGEGGTVILAEDKVRAMRNFANKIWNIGRFIHMNRNQNNPLRHSGKSDNTSDASRISDVDSGQARMTLIKLEKEFTTVKKKILKEMNSYKFSKAFGNLYEFLWHRYADYYIEQLKGDIQSGNISALEALENVYLECLILLHAFMPFVTEAVWKEFKGEQTSILDELIVN